MWRDPPRIPVTIIGDSYEPFFLPPLHGGGHTQHIPTQAWAFCFQCFESSSHPSHLILSRKSRHRPISGYCIMTFLHAVVAKVCVVLKCFLVEVSIWNLYVSTNTFQQITVKREFDTPVLMHRFKKNTFVQRHVTERNT